jgi:hypothetical protein
MNTIHAKVLVTHIYKYIYLHMYIYVYLSDTNPIDSHNSWIKILIKIRDDDVVSCSFNFIYSKHVHGNASVPIKF